MKKLEIEIPNNKEIDWEASAQQKQIVFKDKQLTYEDVCNKLFADNYWYSDSFGKITHTTCASLDKYDSNNAFTKHQLECIFAKNKLANVAVYLNNGWKPNLEASYGYCIILSLYDNFIIDHCAVLCAHSLGKVMFRSEELAQQAIEILGEETVKLALEPLY